MKTTLTTAFAVGALFLGVASCGSNGPTATNNPPPINGTGGSGGGSTVTYQQIERLATPALKEATESFADHQTTNMQNPYVEAASGGALPRDAAAFVGPGGTANRSATTTGAIAKLLFPDVLLADLSQSATTAAYFGVQTGGKTGNTFGGRGLSDDVIDADLGVIFGNTVTAVTAGAVPDDGKESPCLTTDNVPGPNESQGYTSTTQIQSAKANGQSSTTFPYAGNPYTS